MEGAEGLPQSEALTKDQVDGFARIISVIASFSSPDPNRIGHSEGLNPFAAVLVQSLVIAGTV